MSAEGIVLCLIALAGFALIVAGFYWGNPYRRKPPKESGHEGEEL